MQWQARSAYRQNGLNSMQRGKSLSNIVPFFDLISLHTIFFYYSTLQKWVKEVSKDKAGDNLDFSGCQQAP